MQRRQQGCPQGHRTPADSLLGGCLPGLPSSSPHSAMVAIFKPGGDHYLSQPHAFLLGPSGTISGVGTKRQRAGRGDLCAVPQRRQLFGSGPGRGADAQPPPLVLPCPARNVSSEAHQLGGRLQFTEGAVSCHPSPLKPPLSGWGGWGQAGGTSQRPNVLRGGKAEGSPGRTRLWDTWLFSPQLQALAGQEEGCPEVRQWWEPSRFLSALCQAVPQVWQTG